MNPELKKWRQRAQATRPFVGLHGTANTVAIHRSVQDFTIKMNLATRFILVTALSMFGPGMIYLYLGHPERWNPNMPTYVKYGTIFMVAIGTFFFFKFLLFPKKITVNLLDRSISLKKSPFHKNEVINSHEIQDIIIEETTYRSKGNVENDLYILTLIKTDQTKVGLFITTEKELINEFFSLYPINSVQKAS